MLLYASVWPFPPQRGSDATTSCIPLYLWNTTTPPVEHHHRKRPFSFDAPLLLYRRRGGAAHPI